MKIWVAGKKYWMGWGERDPAGTGLLLHTTMSWPPLHSDIATPVNLIYSIPMALIYGPGIAIPQNAPATLDINVDEIRQVIADVLE